MASDLTPADHDTTPIPTDVLRAWVERWSGERPLATREARRLYDAAVAALPPPRRPVTRETPNLKRIATANSLACDTSLEWFFIGGMDPERFGYMSKRFGYMSNNRQSIRIGRYTDGWYEVDEPEPEETFEPVELEPYTGGDDWNNEPAHLPGTRVGERMTEHTPVGAEVHLDEGIGEPLVRIVSGHGSAAERLGAHFTSGGWGEYGNWTVVALPEESERGDQ